MKYFTYEEFDSPDIQGSGQMMNKDFLCMLDSIREEYGKPIRINSGYRTEAHNEKIGGVKNSSHIKGLAADLNCESSKERFELVSMCLKHGIKRIGVGKGFIHIDIDEDKSQNVMWTY
jgi:uncharacterized protein YcbK (DUF882 family)|tara:strand:- start:2334 stop:2687 length:354 start_codon:yes stop_codon:yes gene_type:complete